MQGVTERRPFAVAVNLDPAESDLTPLAPQEFVAMATGSAAATATGESLERPDLTPADIEKKQTVWWFLLFAGAAAVFSRGRARQPAVAETAEKLRPAAHRPANEADQAAGRPLKQAKL